MDAKWMRCLRKSIAAGLLILNIIGVRVNHVCVACEGSRTYFGPTNYFKAMVKAATKQQKRDADSRSLRDSRKDSASQNLKFLKPAAGVRDVVAPLPSRIKFSAKRLLIAPLLARKLPTDLSPTQPPHLHSKK